MSNVIPIRSLADFLNEPFDDEDEDFRNPARFMQRQTSEILGSLKYRLPDAGQVPEVNEIELLELARLSGCTPEEIQEFVSTAVPAKSANVRPMPAEFYRPRAYFCDKLDDDGKAVGLLIAVSFGATRWRLFDLPLSEYRRAVDAVHSREDKTWSEFVQSIDENLVGVVPDEWTAQSALQEFSAPGGQTYENIVSSAAVNFRLAVRALVNSTSLFRLASLNRGRALRHTMATMTEIQNDGGSLGRVAGRGTESHRSVTGKPERAE